MHVFGWAEKCRGCMTCPMVGAAPVVARGGSVEPYVGWWNEVGMRGELENERDSRLPHPVR